MKKSVFALVVFANVSLVPNALARDQIQIVGSSTVYPFATLVAEKLGYRAGIKTPVIESTGTGGGLKLFCSGVGEKFPDITNASRAIKDSELELCKKNGVKDVVEVVVGNDGIAFASSANGKKINITRKQLWLALAEKGPKPSKWSEIDSSLPNAKIEVLIPPPTSGTRDAWNSLVMGKGCDPKVREKNKKNCELLREDGAAIEAGENDTLIVQKLEANRDAFGIFGFSYLDSNRDKIRAATIEGVEISLDTIQSYDYPISRPLFFYVKKAHVGIIPGIQDYLSEFTSNAAMGPDGYLADIGLVPLKDSELSKVRKSTKNLTPVVR